MEIELDREKKAALLQALCQGWIDSRLLHEWIGKYEEDPIDKMTLEDVNAEIRRLEGFFENQIITCKIEQMDGDCPIFTCKTAPMYGGCPMIDKKGT